MPIKICTYSDPYKLNNEPFWNEIKNAAHFCVSQTMVNGITRMYHRNFSIHQIVTIEKLINSLYSEWNSKNIRMRQLMELDNVINDLIITDDNAANVKRSLGFSKNDLIACIRLFKELGIQADNIDCNKLSLNQKYLLNIYNEVCSHPNSAFNFNRVTDLDSINTAIHNALLNQHSIPDFERINTETIVIHGVHQFTAAMLCAIEDISQFINVVFVFNYQEQYSNIYRTWTNIYSLFESKINISSENVFTPMSLMVDSYASNTLADCIGKLCNSECTDKQNILSNIEVLEFENLTEYAGYCAKIFESAQKSNPQNPISAMSEQIYSASSRVNDILRAYFPEQFGERHFLDYPLGHFFVAVMNMWDSENKKVIIKDPNDIAECLNSGIIYEKYQGQLINVYNIVSNYINNETTLSGMISKLNTIKKHAGKTSDEIRSRVVYFDVTRGEVETLIVALRQIEEIATYFYSDFEQTNGSFKKFYSKIHDFIVNKVSEMDDLDNEMKDVISRLLDKLNTSDLPETATFSCLKETMSYYLSQDDNLNRGAKWIVRNFEQIDGDILQSKQQNADQTCYHFCCLSDKNMVTSFSDDLPWPLDMDFFEKAYTTVDWKYQIYLKSKLERNNFKIYALLYGLEFNRVGCKLSYIRNENQKENDLFYMLRLLGLKTKRYIGDVKNRYVPRIKLIGEIGNEYPKNQVDIIRFSMCPLRYVLESVVQEKTLFRDNFLITTYMQTLIETSVQAKLSGEFYDRVKLEDMLNEELTRITSMLGYVNELEKSQMLSFMIKHIESWSKKNNKYRTVNAEERKILDLKHDFLYIDSIIKKILESPFDYSELNRTLQLNYFRYSLGNQCTYCGCKDVCLQCRN